MAYVLAHLSDPHLTLAGIAPTWRDLAPKRALGRLSWHGSRRRRHRPERLQAVVEAVAAAGVDHVAVTGDLTNLGLPAEFVRARRWLDALGGPEHVSLVPGNHDALLAGSWAAAQGSLAPYLPDGLPYLHRRGPLAIIGLSSAVSTPPFCAYGRVGPEQAGRLGALLDAGRQAGLCRVVLLHHPPVDGVVGERKALLDRARVRAVLARHGAELVLSGHVHHASRHTLPGNIPLLVAPSASLPGEPAWQQIEIEKVGAQWKVSKRFFFEKKNQKTFAT